MSAWNQRYRKGYRAISCRECQYTNAAHSSRCETGEYGYTFRDDSVSYLIRWPSPRNYPRARRVAIPALMLLWLTFAIPIVIVALIVAAVLWLTQPCKGKP